MVLHLGGEYLHGRYGDRHAGSFPHVDVPQTKLPRGVHGEGAVLSLCGGPIAHELHCRNRMTMTYEEREGERGAEGVSCYERWCCRGRCPIERRGAKCQSPLKRATFSFVTISKVRASQS